MSYKAHMHESGESYSGEVPAKQPNESLGGPQEVVEGRPLTKENMDVGTISGAARRLIAASRDLQPWPDERFAAKHPR